jgi:hypothetical protein
MCRMFPLPMVLFLLPSCYNAVPLPRPLLPPEARGFSRPTELPHVTASISGLRGFHFAPTAVLVDGTRDSLLAELTYDRSEASGEDFATNNVWLDVDYVLEDDQGNKLAADQPLAHRALVRPGASANIVVFIDPLPDGRYWAHVSAVLYDKPESDLAYGTVFREMYFQVVTGSVSELPNRDNFGIVSRGVAL